MLSLRTLLRHPIQFAIMTFGIALGVAVMVSIDLANVSAARAFDLSASAVTGRATHTIIGSDQGDGAIYLTNAQNGGIEYNWSITPTALLTNRVSVDRVHARTL